MNTTPAVETEVLIVGAGPAGASAGALLATYGIEAMMINKYNGVANTPRAHITNQRTMEVLRDLGIEERVLAAAMAKQEQQQVAKTDPSHHAALTPDADSRSAPQFGSRRRRRPPPKPEPETTGELAPPLVGNLLNIKV